MIGEDFSLQAFQTQIVTILKNYFASRPQDLYNQALRKRIIEVVTQSLEGQPLQQKDGLDQSISQTYYFESLGKPAESDDEAYHLLFRDASINQDGARIVGQVKLENQQQSDKEHLNHQAVLYFNEENGLENTTKIGAILSLVQKDQRQTKQNHERNMGDKSVIKRKRPIQMGRKRPKGKDRIIKIHCEDYDSDYESQTFELDQSQFSGKPKKSRQQKPSKKHQANRRKKPQSRKPSFPQMEQILINWIKSNCQRSIVVSQFEIRKGAMRILQTMDKSKNPYFRASKGWLEKFFKRNKEVYQLLSRERHKSHISTDVAFGLL